MKGRQGAGGCHVCLQRQATGAWRDAHGNVLASCGQPGCVEGFTYSHSLRRHSEAALKKKGKS